MKQVLKFLVCAVLCSHTLFPANSSQQVLVSKAGALGKPITSTTAAGANVLRIYEDNFSDIVAGTTTGYDLKEHAVKAVLRFDNNKFKAMADHFKNWTLTINYKINLCNSSGTWTIKTGQALTINYNPTLGTQYIDEQIKEYENAIGGILQITSIDLEYSTCGGTVTSTGTIPTVGFEDIYLDLVQESNYCFDAGVKPEVDFAYGFNATTPVNNEMMLAWTHVEGAEYYDVEWLFLDIPTTGNADFDFYNATRISTPNNYYNIPLIYPKGKILFRVRGVWMDNCGETTEEYFYTQWSNFNTPTGNTGSISGTTGDYVYDYTGLTLTMNWSSTTGFAEDGKRKDAITYFDGLLKPHQSVTEISTEKNAVIAETIYDYQGRGAVQLMPVPVTSSGIKYYNHFAADFNASNYDVDTKVTNPDALNTAAKSRDYYSTGSDFLSTNGFLPTGGEYAYSQVRFKNDGTGRPVVQSGVGPDHKMGSGHETKLAYGTATGRELDRLFGNEAGQVDKYQKILTKDPNGQVSAQYLDQAGRTVATSIVGTPPSNLLEIDGAPEPPAPTTANLLLGYDGEPIGGALTYNKTITISEAATYTFNYALTESEYNNLCNNGADDCIYNVDIQIADEFGTPVALTGISTSCNGVGCTTGTGGQYNLLDNIIHFVGIQKCTVSFSANLDFGSYTVSKSVSLNSAALNNYLTAFEEYATDDEQQENPEYCYPYPEIEPAPCPDDCQGLCELTYAANGVDENNDPAYIDGETVYTIGSTAWNTLVNDCATDCEDVTPAELDTLSDCDLKRKLLEMDMSPGGQYFDNLPMTFSYAGPGGTYSTGDKNDWLEANLLISGSIPGTTWFNNTFGSTDIDNWTDVRNNWNDAFVTQTFYTSITIGGRTCTNLLQCHPEFCLYSVQCLGKPCTGSTTWNESTTGLTSHDYDMILLAPETFMPSGKTISEYLSPINGMDDNFSLPDPNTSGNNVYWAYDNDEDDPYFDYEINPFCDEEFCDGMTDEEWMENELLNYFPLDVANGYYLSLWYVANDPQNLRSGAYSGTLITPAVTEYFKYLHGNGTPAYPGIISATPGPGQMTKEQFFVQQYLALKNYVRYRWQDLECTRLTSDPAYPGEHKTTTGFSIRFPEEDIYDGISCDTYGDELPSTLDPWPTDPDPDALLLCENSCSSHVDLWLAEIKAAACTTLTSTQVSDISNYLLQLCMASCEEEDTPFGSSYVAGGIAGPSTTFYTFNDVVNHFLGSGCYTADLCYPKEDVDNSACYCKAFNEKVAEGIASSDLPATPTDAEIATYFNTEFSIAVTAADVDIWQAQCSTRVCASEFAMISNHFPQALLDNATDNFEGGSCICENINYLFYEQYGYTDPNNSSQITSFVTNINDLYYGGTEVVTSGDVNDWFDECEAECPSKAYLEHADQHLPDALKCTTPDPIANCNTLNQAIADNQEALLYGQMIDAALDQYIQEYTSTCLDYFEGKETFTMTYTNNETMFTLFYYDQSGNLIKTVPPKGVNMLTTFTNVDLYRADPVVNVASYTVPSHTYVTNYKHNSYNNVVEQTTPDGGKTDFFYDEKGRLVVSQNARQAVYASNSYYGYSNKGYSYTLYDELGRVKEAGELINSVDLTQTISGEEDDFGKSELGTGWWSTVVSRRYMTKTYYDAQPTGGIITDPFTSGVDRNLRNRVVASIYDNNGDGTYESASHYQYDIHGNVKVLYSENKHLTEIGQHLKQINYEYDLISGNVNAVHYQDDKFDEMHHQYYYDADNRLTEAQSSTNGEIYRKEVKYFYYPHGPLKRTEIGYHSVQGIDNAYTIQGWLKHQNSATLQRERDMGLDAKMNATNLNASFAVDANGYSLGYFNGDYTSINNASLTGTTNPALSISSTNFNTDNKYLYNGNIAYTVNDFITEITQTCSTNHSINHIDPNITNYYYDQVNRLKESNFYRDVNARANNAIGAGITKTAGEYLMLLEYDYNGNITTLRRQGPTTSLAMDRLNYSYNTITNKLDYVGDLVSSSAYTTDIDDMGSYSAQTNPFGGTYKNYNYDPIGNLIADEQEKIEKIEWNAQNKVERIIKKKVAGQPNTDLEFRYNPMGQRIMKIAKPHRTTSGVAHVDSEKYWTYTYYSLDATGNVMAVYERTFTDPAGENNYTDEYKLLEQHLYGSNRLGVLKPTGKNYSLPFTASLTGTTNPVDDELFTSESYSTLPTYENTQVNIDETNGINTYIYTMGERHYELTNHLGNVMIVINDRRVARNNYYYVNSGSTHKLSSVLGTPVYVGTGGTWSISGLTGSDNTADSWLPEVESYSDYYAFGMLMVGRHSTGSDGYRYGYQGSEKDNEIKGEGNSYTTEYRFNDPRLGRWLSIDPLAKKYPDTSPFVNCANNPVIFIDIDGRDYTYTVVYEKNSSGTVIKKTVYVDVVVKVMNLTDTEILESEFTAVKLKGDELFDYKASYKEYYPNSSNSYDVPVEVNVTFSFVMTNGISNIKQGENALFIVGSITSQSSGTVGYAQEPGNIALIEAGYFKNKDIIKAILHEKGHNFGLSHPVNNPHSGFMGDTPNDFGLTLDEKKSLSMHNYLRSGKRLETDESVQLGALNFIKENASGYNDQKLAPVRAAYNTAVAMEFQGLKVKAAIEAIQIFANGIR